MAFPINVRKLVAAVEEVCGPERRNFEEVLIKVTWALSVNGAPLHIAESYLDLVDFISNQKADGLLRSAYKLTDTELRALWYYTS